MITESLARIIGQEHRYCPIEGRVLTLGRQLIAMTHQETIRILINSGLEIPTATQDATRTMIDNRTRYSEGKNWITDRAFFLLLGIKDLASLDVTDYEGCDIVHNLNFPIPDELVERYDFVIDGGTFDHLVDLRMCFQNTIRLLKPGGRVFQWNAASNFTGAAYISFGPDLFHDFYVVNRFDDCKVYIAEVDDMGQLDGWDLYFMENPLNYGHFRSSRLQMVLVIAEKAQDSTWDRFPVQSQYRASAMALEYAEGFRRCATSSRSVWQGRPVSSPNRAAIHTMSSTLSASFPTPAPSGFRYIGQL